MIGKKQNSTAITIFGALSKPNQTISSGTIATFGAALSATSIG